MSNVTHILSKIEKGDRGAADKLLPLVYGELRRLAAAKLAHEKPGQTLQATALVHEAYLRLVDVKQVAKWDSRAHFFAAAAEAMRRILVEAARRKRRQRRGGDRQRFDLLDVDVIASPLGDELLDLDDALKKLSSVDLRAAEVVKLRVFCGMTIEDVAKTQGVSPRTVKRAWTYGRAWLGRELADPTD